MTKSTFKERWAENKAKAQEANRRNRATVRGKNAERVERDRQKAIRRAAERERVNRRVANNSMHPDTIGCIAGIPYMFIALAIAFLVVLVIALSIWDWFTGLFS